METLPDIYPLTGLQIGDIQSYVSQAFLYFSPLSKKLLILVDNRPWLMNKHSRTARLWQLMVTKYRMSPFMNSMAHKGSNTDSKDIVNDDDEFSDESFKKSHRWLIKSAKLQTRRLLSTMDLSKALHGFLVFEVAWKNVHGINYLNELQTDTSLAIEVRYMKKWEFYSPDQASNCISLWFVGGHPSETQSLKSYLRKLSDLDDLLDAQLFSKEMSAQRASPLEVVSEEEFLEVQEPPTEQDNVVTALQSRGMKNNRNEGINECSRDRLGMLGLHEEKESLDKEIEESFVSPTQYSYTIILFRFRDNLLPSKLSQEIMSDIRLLTLLESGLPSWVIFFQSYPLFCHLYRPWMRAFARALYILISLATVLIGFYDLYKNVPLLKATVVRLFGWIEAWDMVTRIQYLGTMLFLRNLRKSVKWFILVVARAAKAILTVVSEPLARPLFEVAEFISPLWSACVKASELLSSMACSAIESMYNLFIDLAEIFLSPFELLYCCFGTIVMSICALVYWVWEICLVLFQCGLTFASYVGSLLPRTYNLLKDIWETITSILQLTYLSDAKQSPFDMSDLQDLWNNLFSQVFRAIRSILIGLLSIFTACNRHRLSIHNHMQAVMQHLFRLAHMVCRSCHCQKKLQFKHHNEENFMECDHCK